MSKDDFVSKWRHELSGRILEGLTAGFRGKQLGMYTDGVHKTVDALLEQMHADLISDPIGKAPISLPPKGAK